MRKYLRALLAAAICFALISAAPAQSTAAAPVVLLKNAAATGSQVLWPGGTGIMSIVGTWNGATVTLQYVGPDGSTLMTAGVACTFTSASTTFNCYFQLPRGLIQATVTGAGGSTSLTATASALPIFIG